MAYDSGAGGAPQGPGRGLPVATSQQQAPGLVGGLLFATPRAPAGGAWLCLPGKAKLIDSGQGWPHGRRVAGRVVVMP